jgi:hypothetical protein
MCKDSQHLLIGAACLLVRFLFFCRFITGLQQHMKITQCFNMAMFYMHRNMFTTSLREPEEITPKRGNCTMKNSSPSKLTDYGTSQPVCVGTVLLP